MFTFLFQNLIARFGQVVANNLGANRGSEYPTALVLEASCCLSIIIIFPKLDITR